MMKHRSPLILQCLPAHTAVDVAITVGKLVIVTVAVCDALVEHPVKLPLTVYTVVLAGLTEIADVFAPVLHVYELTPLADKVAVEPAQIVEELTVITGALPTTSVAVADFTQPATEVPVTV